MYEMVRSSRFCGIAASRKSISTHNPTHNEERGSAVTEQSKRVRSVQMIRTLRKLGRRLELQADPT
jgi:hypothetical protein